MLHLLPSTVFTGKNTDLFYVHNCQTCFTSFTRYNISILKVSVNMETLQMLVCIKHSNKYGRQNIHGKLCNEQYRFFTDTTRYRCYNPWTNTDIKTSLLRDTFNHR